MAVLKPMNLLLLTLISYGFGMGLLVAVEKIEVAEKADQKPKPILKIYKLVELIAKADVIVVGEIGASVEGGVSVRVMTVLKAPKREVEKVMTSSDSKVNKNTGLTKAMREAQKLLDKEAKDQLEAQGIKQELEADSIAVGTVENLTVKASKTLKLPPTGTQAVFFLWAKDERAASGQNAYLLEHPQCIYGRSFADRIQVALRNRSAAVREGFLRPWDRRMAIRINAREADEVIKKFQAGNLERGLQLEVVRPRRSLRGVNTFDVTVRLKNSRGFTQFVYDGPLVQYGVRIRKKGTSVESCFLIRSSEKKMTSGLDTEILNIMDATDFVPIKKNGTFARELHFSSDDFPYLKTLDGPYILNVFYTSRRSGKKVEHLDAQAWTGTLVSQDAHITFKRAEK